MRKTQKGFSMIELLIVVTIILIIAAIAIPNLVRSKMTASETAAVATLRTINTTCLMYSTTYGGYPPSLSALGPPASGSAAGATAADLIDSVLATGAKSGYTFTYTAAPVVSGQIPAYTVVAEPITRGSTGQRGFFTDQTGTIRSNPAGLADVNSTPIS